MYRVNYLIDFFYNNYKYYLDSFSCLNQSKVFYNNLPERFVNLSFMTTQTKITLGISFLDTDRRTHIKSVTQIISQ